jgi:hypothetical protein
MRSIAGRFLREALFLFFLGCTGNDIDDHASPVLSTRGAHAVRESHRATIVALRKRRRFERVMRAAVPRVSTGMSHSYNHCGKSSKKRYKRKGRWLAPFGKDQEYLRTHFPSINCIGVKRA